MLMDDDGCFCRNYILFENGLVDVDMNEVECELIV